MNPRIQWLLLLIGVVLIACSGHKVLSPEDLGAVEGVTVHVSGVPAQSWVHLVGTSFITRSDSMGFFRMTMIPPGTYTLRVGESSYPLKITSGDTIQMPRVIFTDTECYGRGARVAVFDRGSGLPVECQNAYEQPSVYISGSTQFTITICFAERSYGYVGDAPLTGVGRLVRGTSVISDTLLDKGRFTTVYTKRAGADTLKVVSDECTLAVMVLIDTSKATPQPYAFLTTGPYSFEPYTGNGWGGSRHVRNDGDSSVTIGYIGKETVDYDVSIVNHQKRDTSSWRKPVPSWAVPPRINRWGDSRTVESRPYLSVYGEHVLDVLYGSDCISIGDLPSGTYSVLVHMYDCPPESASATPRLNVEVGPLSPSGRIQKFVSHQAPRSLRRGEIWTAGRLRVPEMVFDTSDQKIDMSSSTLRKGR